MNEKVTLQIEDRLVSQSFTFRDGSGVSDIASAERILDSDFLEKVDKRFSDMNKDYIQALEGLSQDEYDNFEII